MAEMGARTDDGRAKYLVLPMIVACKCMSASLATGMSKSMIFFGLWSFDFEC